MGTNLPTTDRGLQTYLQNIGRPETRTWIAVGGGLTVCLEPSGAKTFQARVRRQGETNARRVRIGSFPAVSLAQARRKLADLKAEVKEGRDPSLVQRRAKAGLKAPRTVLDLISAYLADRASSIAPKTLKIERDLLEGVLANELGDRLITDLEPVDFGSVITKYAARLRREGRSAGTNANKLLAATRRMFRWGRGSGLVTIGDPTADLVRPAKETPRDRILYDGALLIGPNASLNEIGLLVAALGQEPSALPVSRPTRLALHLTVLLGFRALEVASLEWRAVDLDGPIPSISVTSSKTKAGLRRLPLASQSIGALRELRRAAGPKETYVFPADEPSGRKEHLHPESLSRAFARACNRLGLAHATLHDLRRTCLSGLIELGHEGVAGRIAGHQATGVMGRHYDRSTRFEAIQRALVDWDAAVDAARERAEVAR